MKNSLPFQAIFLILPKQKFNSFLEEIIFNICFSFWWCKGKNYFSITKYFFKKIFIIQMYDKTGFL